MTTSLSSAVTPPEAAQSENARRELQARLAGLGDLRGKKLTPEQKEKKLREACEGFESVFIQKMWQEMRKTVPQGNLLHGREEKFWQDMYDQELAKKMTSAGGIGLSDMMYQQLSRNLVSATRSVTGMAQGAAFTPSAAPLLPSTDADDARSATDGFQAELRNNNAVPATSRSRSLPSMYDGLAPQQGVVDGAAENARPSVDNQPVVMAQPAAQAEADPPEVAEALAQLRLHQTPPANGHIEAVPAGQGVRRHYPQSGLDMARTAQREAGTKLGPAAVRPPLHTSVGTQAPQGTDQNQNARKVRYTTNIPPSGNKRASRGKMTDEMLRAVQAQGTASPPPLTAPAQAGSASNVGDQQAVAPLTAS